MQSLLVKRTKSIIVWIVLILIFAGLFKVFDRGQSPPKFDVMNYSEFLGVLEAGNVAELVIFPDNRIEGKFKNPVLGKNKFRTQGGAGMESLAAKLQQQKIKWDNGTELKMPFWQQALPVYRLQLS